MRTISKGRTHPPVVDNATKTARIPLMDRDQIAGWAVVDLADLPKVGGHRWRIQRSHRCSYAMRSEHIPGTVRDTIAVYLHRVIAGLDSSTRLCVDHVDHDGLNNTRANLRVVTYAENSHNSRTYNSNTSGQTGVSFVPPRRPEHRRRACTVGHWIAYLYRDGAYIHRSSHPTKELAIAARLQAERDYEATKAKETA